MVALTFPDDNSANNGLTSNQYSSTWTATSGDYSWSISNFNNNNWGGNWTYIKCGRKNVASVGTIKTSDAFSEAITKVDVTIDALTASKVNSIKLYTSSDNSSWTEAGTFTKATGIQSVSLSSPAASLYYKVEFDCASGSSNGLVTVSKVEYYHNAGGGQQTVANPSFSLLSDNTGTTTYTGDVVMIECATASNTIYYTMGDNPDDPDNTNYDAIYDPNDGIELTGSTTIKAIAYVGSEHSDVVTKTYTVLTPQTTMAQVFAAATAASSTATDVAVTFNNWVVAGKTSYNAYVTDGQYGLTIYNSGHGFTSGDKLSGTVICKVQLYNGGAELTNVSSSSTGLTVTPDQPIPSPYAVSLANITGAYIGSYVDLGNLTYNGTNFTDGTNTIAPYNSFNLTDYPTLTSGVYRVKGVYIVSGNNATVRIAPTVAGDFAQVQLYTVTYDGNGADGGTAVVDNNQYESGASVTVLGNTFTKTGHEFFCWSNMQDGGSQGAVLYNPDDSFDISANTTLYAQWTTANYNVTLADDGTNAELYAEYGSNSTLIEGDTEPIAYGTELTLTTYNVPSNSIVVWTVTNAQNEDVTAQVLSGTTVTVPAYAITITGVVTAVESYTVTFNAEGGSCSTTTITQNEGTQINLPTATLPAACVSAGWVFAGWATTTINETSTAPSLLTGTYTITQDITLHAVYSMTEGDVFDNTAGGNFMIYATVNNTNYYATGTGSKISTVTDAADATVYTFEKPASYGAGEYAIKSGSTYITYNSGTNLGTSTDPYKWTITQGSYGSWRITASGDNTRGLVYQEHYTNSGNEVYTHQFGGYKFENNVNGDNYYDVEIGGGTTTYNSNPNCMETVAAPEFSPAGGTYTSAQDVTIICGTGEAIIKYKTNENDDWSTYSAAISVSTTTTIWAKATKEGMNDSEVVSATYTIVAPFTPVVYTRASSITSNGHYIIVGFNGEDAYAMGDQSGNIRSAVVISEDGENAIVVNENVFDFVITGNTTDGYTIYDSENDGYLCTVSSSSNNIGTGDSEAWTITFETDGYATVVSMNTTYDRVDLRYNYNSGNTPRFSCYKTTTTMSHVYLYEKSTSVAPTTNSTTVTATDFSATTPAGYRLIASPVNMLNPKAIDGMLTGNYDLYYFDENGKDNENLVEWRNYKVENFLLESGKGYLYASESGTNFSFIGAPYAGSGEIDLDYTEGNRLAGWNLIGNPFANPATLNMPYYKMNDDGDGFTAKIEDLTNPVGIMEGVFVQATAANQTATFTAQTSKGGRQSGIAKVNLNVIGANGTVIDNAIVRFDEGQTLEKFMLHADGTKIFFTEDHKDYAIVCGNAQGQMPVNFKAAVDGTYTISVETENLDVNYLHLIDNKTGMDVDLLATPSYTFEGKRTDYASRFKLVFDANAGNSETNEEFAFISDGNIVISNNGEATLQVIDMLGRIVSSQTVNGNASVNATMTPGMYVLQLVNGNNVKTQKIVVR